MRLTKEGERLHVYIEERAAELRGKPWPEGVTFIFRGETDFDITDSVRFVWERDR